MATARPAITLVPSDEPITELTYPISPEYIERWTAERAIAEIIANAIDADPTGFSATYADGVLEINDAAALGVGAEGMVLGFSDKRGRGDQIGQFGEGLKIASLVLARDAKIGDVFIETVGYAFTPIIRDQAAIAGLNIPAKTAGGAKVLAWRIWPSERTTGTRVRIVVDEAIAIKATSRFRQLSVPNYVAPAGAGVVINDGKPGRVYIGGVFVSERKDLAFSYDLSLFGAKHLQNRDRTVIDGWALRSAIGNVWGECEDAALLKALVDATLAGRAGEAEVGAFGNLRSATQKRIFAELGAEMSKNKALYYVGSHAGDMEAALDLKDRGYSEFAPAKIDPYRRRELAGLLGIRSAATLSRNVAKRKVEKYTWVADKNLTVSERTTLDNARRLATAAWGSNAVDRLRVYAEAHLESGECMEFAGFYQPTNGDIAIKRSVLESEAETFAVLTHEVAHRLAHRFPEQVGLDYPDYRDRSRGFERALGNLAARAALQVVMAVGIDEAVAMADRRSAEEAERRNDPAAHGYEPLPGMVYRRGYGSRFYPEPCVAHEYGQLYGDQVERWFAANPGSSRSAAAAFAKANFVPAAGVRKLMDGMAGSSDWQRVVDLVTPAGMLPAVAWWLAAGARTAYDRATKRTRRFSPILTSAWQAADEQLRAQGGEWIAVADSLRDIATGRAMIGRDTGWDEPFRTLLRLEVDRLTAADTEAIAA